MRKATILLSIFLLFLAFAQLSHFHYGKTAIEPTVVSIASSDTPGDPSGFERHLPFLMLMFTAIVCMRVAYIFLLSTERTVTA